MRIQEITFKGIRFNNDSLIYSEHEADCCEENYADFEQLDDEARNYKFAENLVFEAVDGAGFRFGSGGRMFFVPCYSMQNGWYSTNIVIRFYNADTGKTNTVLSFDAKLMGSDDE